MNLMHIREVLTEAIIRNLYPIIDAMDYSRKILDVTAPWDPKSVTIMASVVASAQKLQALQNAPEPSNVDLCDRATCRKAIITGLDKIAAIQGWDEPHTMLGIIDNALLVIEGCDMLSVSDSVVLATSLKRYVIIPKYQVDISKITDRPRVGGRCVILIPNPRQNGKTIILNTFPDDDAVTHFIEGYNQACSSQPITPEAMIMEGGTDYLGDSANIYRVRASDVMDFIAMGGSILRNMLTGGTWAKRYFPLNESSEM